MLVPSPLDSEGWSFSPLDCQCLTQSLGHSGAQAAAVSRAHAELGYHTDLPNSGLWDLEVPEAQSGPCIPEDLLRGSPDAWLLMDSKTQTT